VREAIEGQRWAEADVQIASAAQAIERAAAQIDHAVALLEPRK
jgi:hypothetical protein